MNNSADIKSGPMAPSAIELRAIYDGKYKDKSDLGWGPRTRLRFGYFSPDEYYESVVSKILQDGNQWADIGCGRDIFPSNLRLAKVLSDRAGYVLGIDPDENIFDNEFITEVFHGTVESCRTDRTFDIVTMRMVAEHIEQPEPVAGQISEFTNDDGFVVVYTPNKWSPMSLLARLTSLRVHHVFKRMLWQTEERDTFPIQYKMNTRSDLRRIFEGAGFEEIHFQYLDDCRTFNRFRLLNFIELSVWWLLAKLGLHYPENCLLAVFKKK